MRGRAFRKRWASRFTAVIWVMLGAVLFALWLTPGEPPRRGLLWQGIWALKRQEMFIPLVVLLVAGVPLSFLVWPVRGRHRTWLVIGWVGFIAAVVVWYAVRVMVMLEVLWWRYGG